MRVIAGKYRSRPLRSLRGLDVRPTTDRLRETLFNVLAPVVEDSVWLDLYAGTGAVGIEALSRGARMVYFVEVYRKAAALIRENLHALGIESGCQVLELEAVAALRVLDTQAVSCDVCFLDPPYHRQHEYGKTINFLSDSPLLKPSSIVIAEHEKHFDPGEKFGRLERYRELKQGDAVLSFYKLG